MLYKIIGIIIILASVAIGGYSWYESGVFGAVTAKIPNKNSLVGYWSFDDGSGTKATDFSGNGVTGTLNGDAAWTTAGARSGALSFDGSGDYVQLKNSVIIAESANSTVSAWAKTSVTGGYIYTEDGGGNAQGYYLGINGSFAPVYGIYHSGWTQMTSPTTVSAGQWHHIVSVLNSSTGMKIYIDGVEVASDPNTLPSSGFGGISSVKVGKAACTGCEGYFNGQIDEVRVYNRALSATEIAALYQSGAAKANVSQNSQSASGLVGQWSFNGPDVTDKVYDRSGQGNNGYFIGGATSSAKAVGKVGQALSFDGTSQYISKSSPTGLPTGQSARTIAFWMYPTLDCVSNNHGAMVHYGNNTVAGQEFIVLREAWSGVCYLFTDSVSSANNITITGAEIPATNQWSHVAFVFNGVSTWSYYINGSLVKSGSFLAVINTVTPTVLNIGRRSDTEVTYFPGKLDEVRVYNRALSASEIAALYQSGAAKANVSQNSQSASGLVGQWSFNGPDVTDKVYDRSGQGNNGYFNGAATGSAKVIGKVGQALSFDGTDDYVDSLGSVSSYPFVQNTGIFTLSAWIKSSDYTATGQKTILSNAAATTESGMFFMYENSSGNRQLRLFIGKSVNGVPVIDSSSSSNMISDNNWHHTVTVGDGTNVTFYVDGVANAGSGTMGSKASGDSSRVMNIGRYNYSTPGGYFNGQIDEVRVYNRALSASEVYFLYNMGR